MKFQKKLFVIVIMVALLMAAAMTCALADEKIYTSPAFKLPKEEIEQWVETLPEETLPEEEEPVEPEEEDLPEDGEQPEGEEPADEDAPVEQKVTIFSSRGEQVTEKEWIYLTSVLEGFDGLEPTFQWQVDRQDGEGWVDVKDANEPTYKFVATKETIQYKWRLIVSIDD